MRRSILLKLFIIFAGVAASAGLSIIPISTSTGLPSWVTPLYVCVSAFSLLGGVLCVWMDKKYRSFKKAHSSDLEAEMNDIEAHFARTVVESTVVTPEGSSIK